MIWLVMREVLLLAAIGVAIGLPGAWALSRFVETQLFGVKPADPATVAAVSGYLPARRAIGIDPMHALRWE